MTKTQNDSIYFLFPGSLHERGFENVKYHDLFMTIIYFYQYLLFCQSNVEAVLLGEYSLSWKCLQRTPLCVLGDKPIPTTNFGAFFRWKWKETDPWFILCDVKNRHLCNFQHIRPFSGEKEHIEDLCKLYLRKFGFKWLGSVLRLTTSSIRLRSVTSHLIFRRNHATR